MAKASGGKAMTEQTLWRTVVVGGHTRSIGKTQLVCDLIAAFPEANWIAGKITQYGHGVCAQNGENCDCAPDEHVGAISCETAAHSTTDSGRFLAAGAHRSFWLRTKQGFLAEGLPLLRQALQEAEMHLSTTPGNLILESNTLLHFWKPALYLMVLDPSKPDFKDSARLQMDRASAFVLRASLPLRSDAKPHGAWNDVPLALLRDKPRLIQREGEALPADLREMVKAVLARRPESIANET